MNTTKHFFALMLGLLVLLLLATGCETPQGNSLKSAHNAYALGSYDSAVELTATALRMKPDYRDAQEFLVQIWPVAVQNHLGSIKRAEDGGLEFKWDAVASEYAQLIQIQDAIKSLPVLIDKKTKLPIHFDIQDHDADLSQAKNHAAEAHYQAGVRLFGRAGIDNRDNAAQEFKKANEYVPNYKDGIALAAEGYYQEGVRLFGRAGIDNRNSAAQEFKKANEYVPNYKDGIALAAEGYYQEGVILANNPDREIQKQAAKTFKMATDTVPNYKDAATQYEVCKKNGVTRVAIIPFADDSGTSGRFGSLKDIIEEKVESAIMNDSSATEYLDIITRNKLSQILDENKLAMAGITDADTAAKAGKLLAAHQILIGHITQVIVAPAQVTRKSYQDQANILVGYEKYYGDDGKTHQRPVYSDISAQVTIFTRTANASISGSCRLIDVESGKVIHTHEFNGKYNFQNEWGSLTAGDQRALSQNSLNMVNLPEKAPPAEAEMVNYAMADLVSSLSSSLKQDVR